MNIPHASGFVIGADDDKSASNAQMDASAAAVAAAAPQPPAAFSLDNAKLSDMEKKKQVNLVYVTVCLFRSILLH